MMENREIGPEKGASEALRWIIELLEGLDIPFQAVGGLAARAYGATRPLVDLDFYVPTGRLSDIATAASTHVVRPPAHHRDDDWDITFMALEYAGFRVELGGADEARYFDRGSGRWESAAIDFDGAMRREILGVVVPLMPRRKLIAYKKALDRAVDRLDLEEIDAAPRVRTTPSGSE